MTTKKLGRSFCLGLTAFPLVASTGVVAASLSGAAWVIDGDTFALGKARIRLWGIDAPERPTPAGEASRRFLIGLLSSKTIFCEDMGQRSYGRIVARCYLPDGEDIARVLVNAGHAHDWPRFSGGFYGGEER